MWKAQKQVIDFHRKFDCGIGNKLNLENWLFRIDLIKEEVTETVTAIRNGDLTGVADGITDSIYVLLGAAVEFGLDIEPLFDEVHRTNMAKIKAATAGGKVRKPPGWKGPDIAGMLRPYIEAGQGMIK